MNTAKTIVMWTAALVAIGFVLYGSYWLAKHGSYALWYEDMVKETIREMVKPEYLKNT